MTLYLDTSLLVAALTREARTQDVRAWMQAWEAGGFSTSQWVATEFSSAMSIKLRSGQIDEGDRAGALSLFARLFSRAFTVLPISDSHFRTAAGFLDQFALGLRSGDALHLAIAAAHGETVCTLDRRMAEAGAHLGVKTEFV